MDLDVIALLPAVLAALLAFAMPASAQPATAAPDAATIDVEQIFASGCGWCHSNGGRAAGKGPQLANSSRSDDYLRNRIKTGKEGAMPAYGSAFSDVQIDAIIKYIRSLKPGRGMSRRDPIHPHWEHGMKAILPLMVGAVIGLTGPAQARSLDTIRSFGTLALCAHPNSLPFASKAGDPPGFQVELGQALARELGVSLKLDWIITVYQMRSADCDILMDVIADREAQSETNLRISKPYYRTGVVLAVPSASKLTSFKSLDAHTKVGVQVGSIAAMIIGRRGVSTSTFGFEVDSLEALANQEIDAAAVTPTVAGYFNLTHPDKTVRILGLDESEADLNWNVAVGMVRPDERLRDAIDGAMERLRADGTVDRIYRRYGVILQSPK